jgi:hypothetical protein
MNPSHLLAYVGRPTSSCSGDSHAAGMKGLVEAWPEAMPTGRRKMVTSGIPTERLLHERSRLLTDVRALDIEIVKPEAGRLQRY